MGKITASQFKLTVPEGRVAAAVDAGWEETPAATVADDQSQALDPLSCPECGVVFTSADATFCPFDGARLLRTASPQHSDPLLGQVLAGRYQVLARLGEGGMGAVYRVSHTTLGKQFAVKVLRTELARDVELSQRFIREARAMARISSPHVIQITDFGEIEEGRPFFVMELLSGRSLSASLREKSMSPASALIVARLVAEALASAHACGIVHRDLKPDNVYVAPESFQVKVLDFGLAHVVGSSRLTQRGVVFGTPQYMSPEQASGGVVDHRADVYSLGIVLYEMLAGKVPFEADSYMGVLTKQMYTAPAPLPLVVLDSDPLAGGAGEPGLGQEIEALVQRCLAKKADERFASMQELIVALDDVMRRLPNISAPISAGVPSSVPPPAALAQRRAFPKRAWLWGLAGLVFLIGMGLWGWYSSSPEQDTRPMVLAPASPVVAPVATPKRPVVRPLEEAASSVASSPGPAPAEPSGAVLRDSPVKPRSKRAPAAPPRPSSKPPQTPQVTRPGAPLGNPDLIDPWSQQ